MQHGLESIQDYAGARYWYLFLVKLIQLWLFHEIWIIIGQMFYKLGNSSSFYGWKIIIPSKSTRFYQKKNSGYYWVDIAFGLHTRPEVCKHNRKMELTGMNVCMFLHIGFLMESFSTVWARERSGIGVNEKMCRKCWRSFELFLTNMTFINLKINIIMILLVNLAKIRKSKLANHLVVWIWQKIVPVLEFLQYVNLTLISGNFEKSWNPQRFFVFISLMCHTCNYLFFSLLMIVVVVVLVVHENIFIFINWVSIWNAIQYMTRSYMMLELS